MSEKARSFSFGTLVKWGFVVLVVVALGSLLKTCIDLGNVMNGGYKAQPAFLVGMALVKDDERIVAALGEPVEEKGLISYNAFSSTDGSLVSYAVNLSGPKGVGQVQLRLADDHKPPKILEAVFADSRGQLTNLMVKP